MLSMDVTSVTSSKVVKFDRDKRTKDSSILQNESAMRESPGHYVQFIDTKAS